MSAAVDYDGPTETVPAGKIMAGDLIWLREWGGWLQVTDVTRRGGRVILKGTAFRWSRFVDEIVVRAIEQQPESE